MRPMRLKQYQRECLDKLRQYLEEARLIGDPAEAFKLSADKAPGRDAPAPYRPVAGLDNIPYVCLRVPTGGGKTIMAAHAVPIAAEAYLQREFPLCLWLVPTSTIRKQTVEALKNTRHPYRQALDGLYGPGKVLVLDISEFTQLLPHDLGSRCIVVVATLQSFRAKNTEGRRVYATNEAFEPHFAKVTRPPHWLEQDDRTGKAKLSFANLCAMAGPLVIVDEAHNARTSLTFETLGRLRPRCIVEMTATPAKDSNVLARVSAAELLAEEMIKLPIVLSEHKTWAAAVHQAVETRAMLAGEAQDEPEHLRPIALYKAQDKNGEVTVEVLKRHLIEHERVAENAIRVATGEQRELDGVDLADPTCPVEHVITIEALKEGWDCPSAYVFCSVTDVRSATAVEQLLGRVLRMPGARRRANQTLNKAYAHVASDEFARAAVALTDKMIENMGFEPEEAERAIETRLPLDDLDADSLPLFTAQPQPRQTVLEVDEHPDLTELDAAERRAIKIVRRPEGSCTLTVSGPATPRLAQAIMAATRPERRERIESQMRTHNQEIEARRSPAERGEKLILPQMALDLGPSIGLQPIDPELLEELSSWTLSDFPASLNPTEFDIREEAEFWRIDLGGRRLRVSAVGQHVLELGLLETDWSEEDLLGWLDSQTRSDDVTQRDRWVWLGRALDHLRRERELRLGDLVRFKFPLAEALKARIRRCREEARERSYQENLFGATAPIVVDIAHALKVEPHRYVPRERYGGRFKFNKHFIGAPGELKGEGEEHDCAIEIERHPRVATWLRNLAGPTGRRERDSFWLPLAGGRFYPDFVGALTDGRTFAVEYKGAGYATNDDSRDKRRIGHLWAQQSHGRTVFAMVEATGSSGESMRDQLNKAFA